MKAFFQFLGAIIIGIVIARYAMPGTPTAQAKRSDIAVTTSPSFTDEEEYQSLIDNLQQQLLDATKERQQLKQQIQQLRPEASLAGSALPGAGLSGSNQAIASDQSGDDLANQARVEQRAERLRRQRDPDYQKQVLRDAGFSEFELDSIDQAEADRIARLTEQRLQRMRDNPEQYSAQLDPFGYQPIREQLGDERFEEYLTALGRNAEITARSVSPGSAAEIAGIQQGDQIYSYDGSRVFQTGDVIRGTINGDPNESVVVEVVRGGEIISLTTTRGTLGVSLGSNRPGGGRFGR